MDLPIVDCKLSVVWRCPECNRRNVTPVQILDLNEEEMEELYRKDHDLESWEPIPDLSNIEHQSEPKTVKCQKCKKEFRNSNFVGEDDD